MSSPRSSVSSRYQLLEQELIILREHLLPEFEPTGSYAQEVYTRTLAYRVLAHAEFEAYFEDRVREIYLSAIRAWNQQKIMSKVIACMIAFSAVASENIPATKHPTQQSQAPHWDGKIKFSGRMIKHINHIHSIVRNNHGIKEENLLSLLLPIGIEADDIDDVWLADMNSFGEERGRIAHSSGSAYRATTLPDPKNEYDRVMSLLKGISDIDMLLNNLSV